MSTMPTVLTSRDAQASLDWALDLTHVSKTYKGGVQALRNIDLRVKRGEVFGLLGPNGAGKSTLVKILMTIIRPTQAQGTMLGGRVGHRATLARVGYLPEHHRFPEYLTGSQVIDFYGAMAGTPRRERLRRRDELLELVGMREWGNAKVKGYSKGMRQRVGIAQALVNNPDLVLLDEPTDGVDPVGRRDIRNILTHLKDQGKTVFLNSHLLSELEMVCDRVAILVQGKVASQGTIEELTRHKRAYEIEIEADESHAHAIFRPALPESTAALLGGTGPGHPAAPTGLAARRGPFLAHLPTGERVRLEGATLTIGTENPHVVQPIIDSLRQRGVVVKAVRPTRPSLEDLFMEAVVDTSTGKALAPGAINAPGRSPQGGAR